MTKTNDFQLKAKTIINKVFSDLKIKNQIVNVVEGERVTRYDVEVSSSEERKSILNARGVLSEALGCKIRIAEFVKSSGCVGIEVENGKREVVDFFSLEKDLDLACESYNKGGLNFVYGKTVDGNPVILDLVKLGNLMIAGSTGSGRSVLITSMIYSLISRLTPSELRLILIDPKGIEFSCLNKAPHQYFGDSISDMSVAQSAIKWCLGEVNRRYQLFKDNYVLDFDAYNEQAKRLNGEILPRLVVVIDEFCEVFRNASDEAETAFQELLALGNRVGIYCVISSQSPTVRALPSKVNNLILSRISLKALDVHSSMLVLNESGAENLLGFGDSLFKSPNAVLLERVTCAYLSGGDFFAKLGDIKEKYPSKFYEGEYDKMLNDCGGSVTDESATSESLIYENPLAVEAVKLAFEQGGISTSFLQRKLGLGYPKACKIIDLLVDLGYISTEVYDGKRKILISKEYFEGKLKAYE